TILCGCWTSTCRWTFISRYAKAGRNRKASCVSWGMTERRQRADDVPAFLLHATPWRETSLVINAFTRDYGVVGMVARGAKRPQSQLRPVLGAFQPLRLSWSGARELKTLRRAESAGIMPLAGRAYMSGWYLNELVLRL